MEKELEQEQEGDAPEPEVKAEEPQAPEATAEAAPELEAKEPEAAEAEPAIEPAVAEAEPAAEPAVAEAEPVVAEAESETAVATAPSEAPAGDGERPRERPGGPDDRRPAEGPDGRPRRRGRGRRRICMMCVDKMTRVDYKDTNFLRQYISDRGRIDSRRKSGNCAKHQRAIANAIKRARHLALIPYTVEHIRVSGVGPLR